MYINNQNKTQKQLQSRLRSSPAPVMGAHTFLQTKVNEIIETYWWTIGIQKFVEMIKTNWNFWEGQIDPTDDI